MADQRTGSKLMIDLLDAARNAEQIEPARLRDVLERAAAFVSITLLDGVASETSRQMKHRDGHARPDNAVDGQ